MSLRPQLEMDNVFKSKVYEEQDSIRRILSLWMSGIQQDTTGCGGYLSLLWWKCIGVEKSLMLSVLSSRVFSLLPSSAGAERSFKVRTRVHNQCPDRFSNDAADRRSGLIYNSAQFERLERGIAASGRGTGVRKMLVLGYDEY